MKSDQNGHESLWNQCQNANQNLAELQIFRRSTPGGRAGETLVFLHAATGWPSMKLQRHDKKGEINVPDDNLKFRLPIKHGIEISAELAVKASAYAASLRPPRTLDVFVEQVVCAALDGRPVKQVVFEWPPKRESR